MGLKTGCLLMATAFLVAFAVETRNVHHDEQVCVMILGFGFGSHLFVLQVTRPQLPQHVCESYAEHECPIVTEEQSHVEVLHPHLLNLGSGEIAESICVAQRCAQSALIRDQACKLRSPSNDACKVSEEPESIPSDLTHITIG